MEDRCARFQSFQKIDAAFRAGDLEALLAIHPAAIPNGILDPAVGICLIYAIYHSPLPFIRRLLDLGAQVNPEVEDGFPPLIAALSCSHPRPGSPGREDLCELLQMLLDHGADPGMRGINDYTALHMAVAQAHLEAVWLLLEYGADPHLATRIDECETPCQMAKAAGLQEIAALLASREGGGNGEEGRWQRGRGGVRFQELVPGVGVRALRGCRVRIRYNLSLHRGEVIQKNQGYTFRVGKREVIAGLDYGVEGMGVGGERRIRVGPHLAYGEQGVSGYIPPGALLDFRVILLEVSSGN